MDKRKEQLAAERDRFEDAGASNQVAYVESTHGPDQDYRCCAYITRHPTRQGLDGGHLHEFHIEKENPRWRSHIPEKDDPSYEAWVRNNPRETVIAKYKDGALTRIFDDRELNAIIEDIKQTYTSDRIKAQAVKEAALREAERGQQRDRDRDR